MIIRKEHFDNGGEVDFTAHFKMQGREGQGRVSLRRIAGLYQVYIRWYHSQPALGYRKEEILFQSENLQECIDFTNNLFGYEDEVRDEEW